MTGYRLKRNDEGNCDCGKCGGSRFSNHPDLFGYVTCDQCETLYENPALAVFGANTVDYPDVEQS